MSPAQPDRRAPDLLRVASYNVRDLKDDAAAAARVVRRLAPDVLCLQEVPRHPLSGHRVADFANACGMLFSGGHQRGGGATIFTSLRVAVTSAEHHRLPVRRFARPRGYAVSDLALPGCPPVRAVSVHLSLDPDERVRHARLILDRLGQPPPTGSMAAEAVAVVLGGDLNERDDGLAWRCLTGPLRAVTGPSPTFPARHPRTRIDAVLASPRLRPADPPEEVHLAEDDLRAATDHLPVWVDVLLGSRA